MADVTSNRKHGIFVKKLPCIIRLETLTCGIGGIVRLGYGLFRRVGQHLKLLLFLVVGEDVCMRIYAFHGVAEGGVFSVTFCYFGIVSHFIYFSPFFFFCNFFYAKLETGKSTYAYMVPLFTQLSRFS